MNILVLNSGSSSVKSQLFKDHKMHFKGHVDGIGLDICKLIIDANFKETEESITANDHTEAIKMILEKLLETKIISSHDEIDAIGHRVVHGGEKYHDSVLITGEVIKDIEDLSEFAPLHNPANLLGIVACQKSLPGRPQVAVFDTSFHSTIPKERYIYPIPYEFYEKYKIRKYGFHGTSYKYITKVMEKVIGKEKKMIICHLGNGSSICAIKNSKSVDTSMGFTPIAGIVMGTRCGDIDAGIIEHFEKKEGFNIADIMKTLNKESGLKGLCGDSDMRKVKERMDNGDEQAKLAFDVQSTSIIKYLGDYICLLDGVDAIVFTAGIGVGAFYLREKLMDYFDFMGIKIDKDINKDASEILKEKKILEISTPDSSVKVFVTPTDEEMMISQETERILDDN